MILLILKKNPGHLTVIADQSINFVMSESLGIVPRNQQLMKAIQCFLKRNPFGKFYQYETGNTVSILGTAGLTLPLWTRSYMNIYELESPNKHLRLNIPAH